MHGLDWIYMIISIVAQWATGKKYWWAWILAGIGQLVSAIICWGKSLYGYVALAVVLNVVYAWNLYKWWRGIE